MRNPHRKHIAILPDRIGVERTENRGMATLSCICPNGASGAVAPGCGPGPNGAGVEASVILHTRVALDLVRDLLAHFTPDERAELIRKYVTTT